jgi:hypothetical protein
MRPSNEHFTISTCILCFLLGIATGIVVFIKLANRPSHLDTLQQIR